GGEGAQRVEAAPRLHLGRQVAGEAVEVAVEQLQVGGPVAAVAERVEAQHEVAHAGGLQRLPAEQDDLGVQDRVVAAERLDADLVELALAPRLGSLVAEELAGVD